ncbi:MAG: glycosyltransferase family 2 protein [Paracoccaceae bacterium]
MGIFESYALRLRRKRWRMRALVKRRELRAVADRTGQIRPGDVLLFMTLRNERIRLPYFLQYYRTLGIAHFLIVDNGSDDGSAEYLRAQPDVSLWHTDASYKRARFGVDWLNWLQRRYGHGHWTLVVDADEFFIYPFHDTRPITALTDWLDASSIRSFGTLLLDMYPKGALDAQIYTEGQNPFAIANWFDSGNYTQRKNHIGALWVQGGVRARAFFADRPAHAPTLNKVPLVKWHKSYVYISSTHALLPRGLNRVYDEWGGEKASGCLLHAKFLHTFADKSREEMTRRQHYANGREYLAYHRHQSPDLWCAQSTAFRDWRQLDALGLMSTGGWA